MPDTTVRRVASAYASALVDASPEGIVALFGELPRFSSPFSQWETPSAVRAACIARTAALDDVAVDHVLAQDDHAVLLWRATVRGEPVEGCDVLTLTGSAVDRVDVYLRPAAVLPTVLAAMTDAWPR